MTVKRFTQEEATKKIGTRVRSRQQIGLIPAGTTGTVTSWVSLGDGYEVVITFDHVVGNQQHKDWFNRDEYDIAFEEIG